MSCANNVLPVYMWPSPGKIPEALCLPPVQVDTVHFSSEATETNGFSRLSSSLNRTAVDHQPVIPFVLVGNFAVYEISFFVRAVSTNRAMRARSRPTPRHLP